MCKTAIHQFLQALPKCEHHIHVEGTFEPDLLFQMAKKHNIDLPQDDPAFASVETLRARYSRFKNLDDFLGYYYIAMSALIDAADFEELAYAYFAKAASQSVRHIEMFFDPQAHITRGVKFSTVVSGLAAAKKRAVRDFDLTIEIIMCLLKHLPVADAEETFRQAKQGGWFNDGTFIGLGMDSSELPYPPEMWQDIYAAANAAGIKRTIHAGEEGPASYVRQALDMLLAQRIDHGIRSFDDKALVRRLAEEQILLTTCPLSNVRLRCISNISEFPLRKLMDSGLRFSINSDDPAYFGGYILENYCALQEVFGLTVQEWEKIAKGAVHGSWCSSERKAKILGEISSVVGRWTA